MSLHPATPTHPPGQPLSAAGWRDLSAARALERLCFAQDAWGYFELAWALLQPGIVRIKATDGPQLVGLVIGESRPFEATGWVASICVHPQYQHRGIGRALLTACEAALPQPVIKLTVRESNQHAIALYQQSGYARVSVWQGYYAGGENGLVMEKNRS
jgi:ribosomal-protein-alanine N-acetyltransferase